MAKKKNSRKALAAALAIVGVAGLSMASASQLNITAAPNIATGNIAVAGACDDAVNVAWGVEWNSTSKVHDIDAVNVTGIAAACNGLTIDIRVFDGATELDSATGVLDNSGSFSGAIDIAGIDDITDVSVTIR